MTEKIIIVCVVLTVVAVIAVLFIRRALQYRKRMAGAAADRNGIATPLQPASPVPQGRYEILFINLVRLPFGYGKQVHIRPEYHRMIRSIIHVVGSDKTTITTYVDNVLKAHFDEYRDVIERLYNESGRNTFNTKE